MLGLGNPDQPEEAAAMTPRTLISVSTALILSLLLTFTAAAETASGGMSDLGVIDFPNAGNAAAQDPFLTGVKALHSFEFEEAEVAFKAAQEADPSFALAYWGEAMSYNHPLWAQQDRDAALQTLARFAPPPDARAAKTPAGVQRGLMEAIDVLYGDGGDKLVRDIAYSDAMAKLHSAYPDDDEVAILYSLSLLGTVRPGDTGFARQMKAGAIAQQVFVRNPNHPGAAHFIIHSFDDPEHAILALPAAEKYAEIAPDAPHALHMPSHIFVQLGMWDGVVASNIKSYKAAVRHAIRMDLERGRSEFHALHWYLYGATQLGNLEDARWAVDEALRTAAEFPTPQVQRGTMMMVALYMLETERWSEFDLADLIAANPKHIGLQFAAGMGAIAAGDLELGRTALANTIAERMSQEQNPRTAYMAKIVSVGEKELEAALALAEGNTSAAAALLGAAADIEAGLNAPSGPPSPMKPAFEMYGEFLLDQGRYAEAEEQFKQALARTLNRTRSVEGLSKARSAPADTAALR
jgi:tetratricopeptide (TPR) repeat protein